MGNSGRLPPGVDFFCENRLATDQHADARIRAKTRQPAGQAPHAVLIDRQLDRQMKRQNRFAGLGAHDQFFDRKRLSDIARTDHRDLGESCGLRRTPGVDLANDRCGFR
jgi:hypothetical protein